MDSNPASVYEDFDVLTEWIHEALELDTLIVHLPGFTKEQLKVQVTTGGNLRICGDRWIGGNKFSRFSKEIPIPSHWDQNKIKANFMGSILRIKHPKLIVAKPSPQPPPKQAPPVATMEKQTRDESVEKENVEKSQPGINMVWLKYKQVVDGLDMGIKNPTKMTNMVLAVLLIVLLNWVWFILKMRSGLRTTS